MRRCRFGEVDARRRAEGAWGCRRLSLRLAATREAARMSVSRSWSRTWVVATSLVLLLLAQASLFSQEPDRQRPEPPRGPRRGGPPNFGGFGGMGGGPPPRFERQPERVPEQPIETGYLFLDGQYLAPPYKIRLQSDCVTVNGRPLPCRPPEQEVFGRPGFAPDRRFENPDPLRRLAVHVGSQLMAQSVVMAFTDQPLVILDGTGGSSDLFQR